MPQPWIQVIDFLAETEEFVDNEPPKRFASFNESDLDDIEALKDEPSTAKQTKWGIKLLKGKLMPSVIAMFTNKRLCRSNFNLSTPSQEKLSRPIKTKPAFDLIQISWPLIKATACPTFSLKAWVTRSPNPTERSVSLSVQESWWRLVIEAARTWLFQLPQNLVLQPFLLLHVHLIPTISISFVQ